MTGRIRIFVAVLALILPWRVVSARPAEDPREVQGRALFAKGEYQSALDIYATLFGERGDPVYLRNIGRCYQKLEQPDKAINSFREYLQRGHVKRGERTEVEGFIKEMEELEKQQAAVTPAPGEPVRAAPATDTERASIATPPPPANTEPTPTPTGATLTQQAATEEPASATPITHRWWFWTGIAVLVVGGAATAVALTHSRGGATPLCPSGVDGCQLP